VKSKRGERFLKKTTFSKNRVDVGETLFISTFIFSSPSRSTEKKKGNWKRATPNFQPDCEYQVVDNYGYVNCTRGDGHIGLCTEPCPYQLKHSAKRFRKDVK